MKSSAGTAASSAVIDSATGFAVRAGAPGAPQRFSAVPLQISAQEAERDRSFTRQAFSTQLCRPPDEHPAPHTCSNAIRCGLINSTRSGRASCRDASSGLDCNSSGLSCGPCPAAQPLPSTGQRPPSQQQPGAPADAAAAWRGRDARSSRPHTTPQQQRVPPGAPPQTPHTAATPGARPTLQQQPGAAPSRRSTECADVAAAAWRAADLCSGSPERCLVPQRAPAGQRKPAKKNESR